MQAQADQQAEHMRKIVEEKRKKRLAQEQEEKAAGKWAEPLGLEVESRGKWAEPRKPPQIARQYEATGSVSEGIGGEREALQVLTCAPHSLQ